MQINTIQKVAVIRDADAGLFEEKLNETLELLAENNPELLPENIFQEDGVLTAVIRYTATISSSPTIRDEYHLEGIRHICAECPLHDIEVDSRRKWVTCSYAELGETHLQHECCDYFYKQLKLGLLKPGEPNRSGKFNEARVRR